MTTKSNKIKTVQQTPETDKKREYQFSIEEIAKQTIHAFHEATKEKEKIDLQKTKEQNLLWEKEALKIMEKFPVLLKEALLKGEKQVCLIESLCPKTQYTTFPTAEDKFGIKSIGSAKCLEHYFKTETFSGFYTNLVQSSEKNISFIVTWDTTKIKLPLS
jgi:hypothetical protein